jgi:hypothetical protein
MVLQHPQTLDEDKARLLPRDVPPTGNDGYEENPYICEPIPPRVLISGIPSMEISGRRSSTMQRPN